MVRSLSEFFSGHVTHGQNSLSDNLADRQKAVAESQQAVEQSTRWDGSGGLAGLYNKITILVQR